MSEVNPPINLLVWKTLNNHQIPLLLIWQLPRSSKCKKILFFICNGRIQCFVLCINSWLSTRLTGHKASLNSKTFRWWSVPAGILSMLLLMASLALKVPSLTTYTIFNLWPESQVVTLPFAFSDHQQAFTSIEIAFIGYLTSITLSEKDLTKISCSEGCDLSF